MKGRRRCLITAQSCLGRLPRDRPRCGLEIYSKGASVQESVLPVLTNTDSWRCGSEETGGAVVKHLITWQEDDELSEHTLMASRQRNLACLLLTGSRFEACISQHFTQLSPTPPSEIRKIIHVKSSMVEWSTFAIVEQKCLWVTKLTRTHAKLKNPSF